MAKKTIATFVYNTKITTTDNKGEFVAVHSKKITGVLVDQNARFIRIKPAVLNHGGKIISVSREITKFLISKISGPIKFE